MVSTNSAYELIDNAQNIRFKIRYLLSYLYEYIFSMHSLILIRLFLCLVFVDFIILVNILSIDYFIYYAHCLEYLSGIF